MSGETLLTDRAARRIFPDTVAIADGACARFLDDATKLACKHVFRGATAAALCSHHTHAGLLCEKCYRAHTARHTREVENGCDSCGEIVDEIWPQNCFGRWDGQIMATDGRRRTFSGLVFIATLGLCTPCHETATAVIPRVHT